MRTLLFLLIGLLSLGLMAPAAAAPPADPSAAALDDPAGLDAVAEALARESVIVADRTPVDRPRRSGASARPQSCERWTTMQSVRFVACAYDDPLQARQSAWQQAGPLSARRVYHAGRVVVHLPAGSSLRLHDAVARVMTPAG